MIIIIVLPLCVSEGDCLDVMIFVVLDKDSKDCVATKGGVDQEVALVHSDVTMLLLIICQNYDLLGHSIVPGNQIDYDDNDNDLKS